jgi:hypothetical protein
VLAGICPSTSSERRANTGRQMSRSRTESMSHVGPTDSLASTLNRKPVATLSPASLQVRCVPASSAFPAPLFSCCRVAFPAPPFSRYTQKVSSVFRGIIRGRAFALHFEAFHQNVIFLPTSLETLSSPAYARQPEVVRLLCTSKPFIKMSFSCPRRWRL